MQYRKLRNGTIIRECDENKQQFKPFRWERAGSLIGKKVGEAIGSLTSKPFEIRRPLKNKVSRKSTHNSSTTPASKPTSVN